jgi:hypothetical protein
MRLGEPPGLYDEITPRGFCFQLDLRLRDNVGVMIDASKGHDETRRAREVPGKVDQWGTMT